MNNIFIHTLESRRRIPPGKSSVYVYHASTHIHIQACPHTFIYIHKVKARVNSRWYTKQTQWGSERVLASIHIYNCKHTHTRNTEWGHTWSQIQRISRKSVGICTKTHIECTHKQRLTFTVRSYWHMEKSIFIYNTVWRRPISLHSLWKGLHRFT